MCFTLAALRPVCSLCVVPSDGGIECGCCSWQHRGTHHAGITGPGGKKRTFLCLDHRAQRDRMLKQSRKLIGYTYLVCLCLFGPLFSLPSIEGRAFPLSLISTVERHGGGE